MDYQRGWFEQMRVMLRWPWVIGSTVMGALGVLDTVRGFSIVPWYGWVIGILLVLVIGLVQGSRRESQRLTRTVTGGQWRLMKLREYGVKLLYANPPRNDAEFSQWKKLRERWVDDVRRTLRQTYGAVAESKFWILGRIEPERFGHAYNDDHEQELRILMHRMDILAEIVETNEPQRP